MCSAGYQRQTQASSGTRSLQLKQGMQNTSSGLEDFSVWGSRLREFISLKKGSFPWGEIGAWLLQIGREIPCEEQRGTKAALQGVGQAENWTGSSSREVNSKDWGSRSWQGQKGEEEKLFHTRGRERERFKGGTSWPQKATCMVISCCQHIRGSLPCCIRTVHVTLCFQPDAAGKQVLAYKGAVLYTVKYISSLCTGAGDLITLKFMEL